MEFRTLKSNNHLGLLHPRQTILCSSSFKGETNIITLAWTMIISRTPPIVAISVAPQRHSHGLIKNSGEFTINVPTKELISEVYYCGSHSGRNVDKFSKANLTPLNGLQVKCPRIEKCIAHVECEVMDDRRYGDHTLFVGKVVSCSARNDVLKGKEVDLEKVSVPYHVGGREFVFNKKELFRV